MNYTIHYPEKSIREFAGTVKTEIVAKTVCVCVYIYKIFIQNILQQSSNILYFILNLNRS